MSDKSPGVHKEPLPPPKEYLLTEALKANTEALEKNIEATNRFAKAMEDFIEHQWHSVR